MTEDDRNTNMLTVPALRVRLSSHGTTRLSIPELYAALMADDVLAITALRPHQKHALHAFLVQVGALALRAAGTTELPAEADGWRSLLRGLTKDYPGDEPWTLVVADVSKPALLQPPIPEGTLETLDKVEQTPDAIDTLVTSRNHDLKAERLVNVELDDWLFAVLAQQTTGTNLGAGNYEISRIRDTYGSRSAVGIAPKGLWGAHVRRDIRRLSEVRQSICDDNPIYKENGGLGLLWLSPWDGTEQLKFGQLDPYYIEVCRRIRLVRKDDKIRALRCTTEELRIDCQFAMQGKTFNRATGDPWAPVVKTGGVPLVFKLNSRGFSYDVVAKILDGAQYAPAPMQFPTLSDGQEGLTLVMSGIANGQGGTEGSHSRAIPLPPKIVPMLQTRRDRLAELSNVRVDQAGQLKNQVLKAALLCLFQNAPKKIDPKHKASLAKSAAHLSVLDRTIDRTFFEDLFDELAAENPDDANKARNAWLRRMKVHAGDILATAEAGSPLSLVRRYQTRAAAESVLDGAFRRVFPEVFEVQT